MKTIGITTIVPVEVLIAAGYRVVDLNNLFITSADYYKYIEAAERDGFPKSSCAWIKGIYGACLRHKISEVVGVIEGDCSNTRALIEVLKTRGVKEYPFCYPHTRRKEDIKAAIDNFMGLFNVTAMQVENVREDLNIIRKLAGRIDELTYTQGRTTGFENHLYQVMLSDFGGDTKECARLIQRKISEAEDRPPVGFSVRLGYIGVPPMTCDIYDFVEKFNAGFVFNEVQREFAFPRAERARDIYEQYTDYTYPYDVGFRLSEIKRQIKKRRLDGIVHYTQAFCYRAIEDIVIKRELDIPVITIEGDKLNCLDARTKLRLESFIDMLNDSVERGGAV